MPTLPVFAIVKRAFVFFSLNLGTLIKLFAIAAGLTAAAAALAAGGFALTKSWVPAVPCLAFVLFAWAPCLLRTYQLAALGDMDPSSYLSAIFTSQSLRFVGYWLAVVLIAIFGVTLSLLPAILTGALGDQAVIGFSKPLSFLVSVGLMLLFFVMICPVYLVYPAVALEREPSLAQAYALASHCKIRFFLTMALPALFFGLLSQGVEMLGGAFHVADSVAKALILIPLNLVLAFTATVVNAAVLSLSYRYLRGLPHHDPAGPLPGEAPAWPRPQAANPTEQNLPPPVE